MAQYVRLINYTIYNLVYIAQPINSLNISPIQYTTGSTLPQNNAVNIPLNGQMTAIYLWSNQPAISQLSDTTIIINTDGTVATYNTSSNIKFSVLPTAPNDNVSQITLFSDNTGIPLWVILMIIIVVIIVIIFFIVLLRDNGNKSNVITADTVTQQPVSQHQYIPISQGSQESLANNAY